MSLVTPETDIEQGTAAWRQQRAGSVTGSGFANILTRPKSGSKESKTRQGYRLQLVTERITGQPVGEINAAALSWGKEHEEDARLAYEMREHVFVDRVGFQSHKSLDWVGASPDGLVGDDGMIEIKCPFNTAVHLLTVVNSSAALAAALAFAGGDDGATIITVPEEHIPQIQGNMWVLNRKWCDFISYDPRVPEHLKLYVARVYRDEAFIAKLEAEVLKFLDEIENNVGMLLAPTDNFPDKKATA